jgi:hypothetical protein
VRIKPSEGEGHVNNIYLLQNLNSYLKENTLFLYYEGKSIKAV